MGIVSERVGRGRFRSVSSSPRCDISYNPNRGCLYARLRDSRCSFARPDLSSPRDHCGIASKRFLRAPLLGDTWFPLNGQNENQDASHPSVWGYDKYRISWGRFYAGRAVPTSYPIGGVGLPSRPRQMEAQRRVWVTLLKCF